MDVLQQVLGSFLWLWLALLIVFIVTEILTLGLTTIWFAGGAAVALILAGIGVRFPIQLIVFLIVSFVLLLAIRPLANSRFNGHRTATNVDSMVGREGVVSEEIDNLKAEGAVLVSGQEWTARSADPDVRIPKEAHIIVESVEGVKLIVRTMQDA